MIIPCSADTLGDHPSPPLPRTLYPLGRHHRTPLSWARLRCRSTANTSLTAQILAPNHAYPDSSEKLPHVTKKTNAAIHKCRLSEHAHDREQRSVCRNS